MASRQRNSFVIAVAALLAGACHATVEVPVKSSTTIKGGGLLQQLAGDAFGDFANIDLSNSTELKNAGVPKDHIESVHLKSFVIRVKTPAGATLSFLDDIKFSVESDGLPKKLVAQKLSIPDDATSITLDLLDAELAPYVVAPKMALTTEANARAPNQDTTIEAEVVFLVDPKL